MRLFRSAHISPTHDFKHVLRYLPPDIEADKPTPTFWARSRERNQLHYSIIAQTILLQVLTVLESKLHD
jgi:hypothetical protein